MRFVALVGTHFNSRPSARGDMPTGSRNRKQLISIHAPPRGATLQTSAVAYRAGFQFTPLREGRPLFSISCGLSGKFQFTPLREGRPPTKCASCKPTSFQFTPLREGRRWRLLVHTSTARFQFTPLREGRQAAERDAGRSKIFQFTPLREGRHALVHGVCWGYWISIHAPPRGATL